VQSAVPDAGTDSRRVAEELFADQIDRSLIHSPTTGRSGMRRPQQLELARYFNNVGRGL
jgi:hypothetical protein